MVDIFEIIPQASAPPGATASQFADVMDDARLARAQRLASKLNANRITSGAGINIDYTDEDLPGQRGNEPANLKVVESDDDAFVGTFADAAAAASTRN